MNLQKKNKKHKLNIVIVGGGFGGVKAALELSKDKLCHVTLVSDKDDFVFYPALYATATGATQKISAIPLATIFAGHPVNVVKDYVVGLDTHRRHVVGKKRHYEYNRVIFALGVVTNYFGIKGLETYSLSIKSPNDVSKFRRHIHNELIAEKHFDKNYMVVGAGPTGVELAASLHDYLLRTGERHKLRQHRVKIQLIEAAPRVLPRLSEKSSQKVEKRLKKLGVSLLLGTAVKEQDDDSLVAGTQDIPTKTVVWTSGVANHPFFAEHSEIFELAPNGRVKVNDQLEAFRDVYVVGDNAATPYTGLAQTALYDAHFVARVIRARLHDHIEPSYEPKRPTSVVPVGHGWAVLERGKFRLSGRSAAVVRSLADLMGYLDILPLRVAVRIWLSDRLREELDCEVCKTNTISSRLAPEL